MAKCGAVQADLTAWCDGELSRTEAKRIEQHLAGCLGCSAEAESVRAAIRWQRQVLPRMTTVAGWDLHPLQARLRRALAAEPEPAAPFWSWVFRPVAIAAAAATLVVVLLFSVTGGPNAVLIPLGVESPPVAVSSETELFENYQLIQHLDAFENFDTVDSVPLEEDQTVHEG